MNGAADSGELRYDIRDVRCLGRMPLEELEASGHVVEELANLDLGTYRRPDLLRIDDPTRLDVEPGSNLVASSNASGYRHP